MIQQPDLGKRIADLRKAKGFTQEELVERCNLSVRTIQRIEAGEVTPRPNTVKLIFEALEVPIEQTMNNKGLIQKWPGQLYIGFIDLFNLKTNTMKKVTILSLMVSAVIIAATSLTNNIKAQEDNKIKNQSTPKAIPTKTQNNNLKVSGTFSGWNNEEEFIARDATITTKGIHFNVKLIKIDKRSSDFKTFVSGKLYENKIEVFVDWEELDCLKYESLDIVKSKNKIELFEKAKLSCMCGSSIGSEIEANEIVININ